MVNEEKSSKQSIDFTKVSFTDADAMQQFVTETGKILPRRITRLTAKQQRRVTKAIKQARSMLLMK